MHLRIQLAPSQVPRIRYGSFNMRPYSNCPVTIKSTGIRDNKGMARHGLCSIIGFSCFRRLINTKLFSRQLDIPSTCTRFLNHHRE